MQTTDNGCQTLDTVLGLVVSFIPAAAHPLPLALQTPWQPPITPQQAPAWEKVLFHLPSEGALDLAPTLGLLPPARAQVHYSPQLHAGLEPELPGGAPGLDADPAGPGICQLEWKSPTPEEPQALSSLGEPLCSCRDI